MDGGSGSGCGCCSCGCLGCLMPIIATVLVFGLIFAIFTPMNHDFQNMTPEDFQNMMPDDFQEYFPDFNDGSRIPWGKGLVAPCYELSDSSASTSLSILTGF